ncbi:hypothetical protein [Mesorhizobium sp.]|uniref:hypothetical protein n=1 Tax=Mesorhizobium sp. TaxID=1871066 RepID=UPI0025F35CAA|nr:hypothetical protein [Mesorhizobium sp.]
MDEAGFPHTGKSNQTHDFTGLTQKIPDFLEASERGDPTTIFRAVGPDAQCVIQ